MEPGKKPCVFYGNELCSTVNTSVFMQCSYAAAIPSASDHDSLVMRRKNPRRPNMLGCEKCQGWTMGGRGYASTLRISVFSTEKSI